MAVQANSLHANRSSSATSVFTHRHRRGRFQSSDRICVHFAGSYELATDVSCGVLSAQHHKVGRLV
eukprot:scaffold1626_cov178-Alexandrium_tamarense.AAC.16